MAKKIEVRAALNFERFRQGRAYEISSDDDRLMSLLGVGYLEPTSDLEADYAGWDRSSELGMGADDDLPAVRGDGVARSSEAARVEGVVNVADSAAPDGNSELGARKRPGSRTGIVKEGADRGEDFGKAGDA